jgi:ketoreductase RED1
VLVGHPFNPPHIVPLVEVVAGTRTEPALVRAAVDFYRGLGKTPVVLRRPVPGFVANRLQSALLRESIHLVREGVVTVDELDEIVTASIGSRWAVVGPFQAFHLGGGPGGLRHWLEHLGGSLERSWSLLGNPPMDEETRSAILAQADASFGAIPYEELAAQRDAGQNAVLAALATAHKD